jgi:hypothetical protein
MKTLLSDLSVKLIYVAILAGLILAFTDPAHISAQTSRAVAALGR